MSEEFFIMKDIMQLLVNRCDNDSVVNYDCSKLWFNFRYGGMMLEVDCKEGTEDKYCFKDVEELDIEEFCNDVRIGDMFITNPVSIKDEPFTDCEMNWKMFQMVRFINSFNSAAL